MHRKCGKQPGRTPSNLTSAARCNIRRWPATENLLALNHRDLFMPSRLTTVAKNSMLFVAGYVGTQALLLVPICLAFKLPLKSLSVPIAMLLGCAVLGAATFQWARSESAPAESRAWRFAFAVSLQIFLVISVLTYSAVLVGISSAFAALSYMAAPTFISTLIGAVYCYQWMKRKETAT